MKAPARSLSRSRALLLGGVAAAVLAAGCDKGREEPMPTPATVVMPATPPPAVETIVASPPPPATTTVVTSTNVAPGADRTETSGSISLSRGNPPRSGGTVSVITGTAPPPEATPTPTTLAPATPTPPAYNASLPGAASIGPSSSAPAGGDQPPSVAPGTTR